MHLVITEELWPLSVSIIGSIIANGICGAVVYVIRKAIHSRSGTDPSKKKSSNYEFHYKYLEIFWNSMMSLFMIYLLYSSMAIWINPGIVTLELMGIFFILSVSFLLFYRYLPGSWSGIIGVVFIGVLIVAIQQVSAQQDKYVALKCPSVDVPQQFNIEGVCIRDDWDVRVLVHSDKADGLFIQRTVRTGPESFKARCNFAGNTGDEFNVIAMAGSDLSSFGPGGVTDDSKISPEIKRSRACRVVLK